MYDPSGQNSGGGFSCTLNNQAQNNILLDFIANKEFFDNHLIIYKYNSPILFGKIGKTLGYEKIKITELPAFKSVEKTFKKWEASHSALIEILRKAINAMVWRFARTAPIEARDSFVLDSNSCLKLSHFFFQCIPYALYWYY